MVQLPNGITVEKYTSRKQSLQVNNVMEKLEHAKFSASTSNKQICPDFNYNWHTELIFFRKDKSTKARNMIISSKQRN